MYTVPNNRLNIIELHRKMNQKNEKKNVCYEKVLEICNKRILVQTERDKTRCLFEFPEYVPGYPLFDLNACIQFCERQLVVNGFLVKYFFPNKLYISWDFEEIKKHKEDMKKKTPLGVLLPPKITRNQPQLIQEPMGSHQQPTTNFDMNSDNMVTSKPQQQPKVSTPLPQLHQALQQTMQSVQSVQTTQPTFVSNQQPIIPSALQAKMTAPLPTSLPKYDPFDLYSQSIHSPDGKGGTISEPKKASAIDNSYFANSFKQTLTSGIGASKIFDYKPSGKLTLNL